MRHRTRRKPAMVMYDIKAKCLDLEEFSGFLAGRKRNRLYESIMEEISGSVLDVFEDVETYICGMTGDGFHIILWIAGDGNRMARVMAYVRGRFEDKVNRSLDRVGPVWDGNWTWEMIRKTDLA